jgi:hypothetical protein
MTARIITLDIETSPILAYVWGLFKQFVNLNQIHTDWSILSFSYKVLGEKKVHHHNTGGRGASKVRDDRALLKLLWNVLDEADIVVAQNGVKFDMKKINARFLESGMPPPTPFKVVDTMLAARSIAGFTSNKLAWLSEVLTETLRTVDRVPGGQPEGVGRDAEVQRHRHHRHGERVSQAPALHRRAPQRCGIQR